MRKLKLQMQLSLDGFVAGPNGELDWMTWNWDDALKDYAWGITHPVDLILLGRKTALGFIPHWAKVAANPEDPENKFGRKMNDTPKIVFSKTLETVEGNATSLIKEAGPEAINQLKQQPGGDIIAYGGAAFIAGLFEKGLIDEYHLFINPVVLGKGMSIFNGLSKQRHLKSLDAKSFSCGVTVLVYQPGS